MNEMARDSFILGNPQIMSGFFADLYLLRNCSVVCSLVEMFYPPFFTCRVGLCGESCLWLKFGGMMSELILFVYELIK
jgi:hypothetical protein